MTTDPSSVRSPVDVLRPPDGPSRTDWRFAAALVGATFALQVLAGIVFGIAAGADDLAALLLGAVLSIGWRGLAWAAIVVALTVPRRSVRWHAGWAIVAAPVVTIAGGAIESSLSGMGWLGLTTLVPGTLGFTLCAVGGALVALTFRTGRRAPRQVIHLVAWVLVVIGATLTFALVVQYFQVYFAIWTPAEPPTASEILRYQLTAWIGLGCLGVAVVLGLFAGRPGLSIGSGALLAVGFLIALLFAVPRIDWDARPAYQPDPAHPGRSCFGGDDCPGG